MGVISGSAGAINGAEPGKIGLPLLPGVRFLKTGCPQPGFTLFALGVHGIAQGLRPVK